MYNIVNSGAATDVFTLIQEIIAVLIFLIFLLSILRKIIKNCFSIIITTKAKIMEKISTTYKPVKKIAIPGTVTDYIIVFYAGGKTLRFKTSVWVYNSFKKGETGTLKYKGDRFISFK